MENFVLTVTTSGSTRYVVARYTTSAYAEPVATVGENVKRLRERAGIATQIKLAELMAVPQSRVSDLENDRYVLPDTKTLMMAAAAIGCLVDDLLSDVDPDYDAKKGSGLAEPRPATSSTVRKVVRLLEQMNDDGQRLVAQNVALLVRAFPRDVPPKSGGPPRRKP